MYEEKEGDMYEGDREEEREENRKTLKLLNGMRQDKKGVIDL